MSVSSYYDAVKIGKYFCRHEYFGCHLLSGRLKAENQRLSINTKAAPNIGAALIGL